MSNRAEYIRCRNCGQYRLSEDMYHGFYCSRECSEKYAQCKNCGAYFLSLGPSTDEFCSEECETSWHTPQVHIPHSHTDEQGVII
ncbi:MAG: hypothetical protein SVR04_04655 [Spirochaetota bacterium]|nr:hypothetical protein [Spirochaetota bacterium]